MQPSSDGTATEAQIMQASDLVNNLGCQLREREVISASLSLRSFSIRHVVGVGAEVEMVGTNAGSHVAAVEDPQAVGDRAMGQLVGVSVSLPGTAIRAGDRSIADVEEAARPQPAFPALIDLRPEAFLHRNGERAVSTHPYSIQHLFR